MVFDTSQDNSAISSKATDAKNDASATGDPQHDPQTLENARELTYQAHCAPLSAADRDRELLENSSAIQYQDYTVQIGALNAIGLVAGELGAEGIGANAVGSSAIGAGGGGAEVSGGTSIEDVAVVGAVTGAMLGRIGRFSPHTAGAIGAAVGQPIIARHREVIEPELSPTLRSMRGMMYIEQLRDDLNDTALSMENILNNPDARETLLRMTEEGFLPVALDPAAQVAREMGIPHVNLLLIGRDIYDLRRSEEAQREAIESMLKPLNRGIAPYEMSLPGASSGGFGAQGMGSGGPSGGKATGGSSQ